MSRLETRYSNLDEQDRLIDIYGICLFLKMSKDGSGTPLSNETQEKYKNFLVATLKTWDEPSTKWDNIIKNLVEETLLRYCDL